MPYDESLAHRIRSALKRRANVTEKKMFGGLAFLLNGKMFRGIAEDPKSGAQESVQTRKLAASYFGISLCETLMRYPALRNDLASSSDIITERCCPPVHPIAMVR